MSHASHIFMSHALSTYPTDYLSKTIFFYVQQTISDTQFSTATENAQAIHTVILFVVLAQENTKVCFCTDIIYI